MNLWLTQGAKTARFQKKRIEDGGSLFNYSPEPVEGHPELVEGELVEGELAEGELVEVATS